MIMRYRNELDANWYPSNSLGAVNLCVVSTVLVLWICILIEVINLTLELFDLSIFMMMNKRLVY